MTTTLDTPRIYVASLSDYVSGTLHGTWIDLDETTTADDIHEQTKAMLATSREPIAEEWAIHDYDNFGSIHLSEYESFERVASLAAAIAEHGDAFKAWARDDYRLEHPENFEDAYLGQWDSEEDYARQFIDDCGLLNGLSETLQNYFDYESYARDMFFDLESVPDGQGGIYVFDCR
jgi:antirestriction protein